jgi:hypothetical protein
VIGVRLPQLYPCEKEMCSEAHLRHIGDGKNEIKLTGCSGQKCKTVSLVHNSWFHISIDITDAVYSISSRKLLLSA